MRSRWRHLCADMLLLRPGYKPGPGQGQLLLRAILGLCGKPSRREGCSSHLFRWQPCPGHRYRTCSTSPRTIFQDYNLVPLLIAGRAFSASRKQKIYQHVRPTRLNTEVRCHDMTDNPLCLRRPLCKSARGSVTENLVVACLWAGVYWSRTERVWRAVMTLEGGGTKFIGRFTDEDEAARAYDR